MLKHKYIDAICITGIILAVLGTILFINGEQWGLQKASSKPGYVSRLFDKTKVHQIDIHMDDWKGFLANAHKEEYTSCTVVIDGEIFHDVGIRAKGNNSLRLTVYNLRQIKRISATSQTESMNLFQSRDQ